MRDKKNDIENTAAQPQNLILENRRMLTVSGITDADSFDDKEIRLYTQLGELVIHGNGLHIESMSVESGDMVVSGEIQALVYGDADRRHPLTAIGKLFR